MLPVVCIGGNSGFELEAATLAVAVAQMVDIGTGMGAKGVEGSRGALQLFERDNLLIMKP